MNSQVLKFRKKPVVIDAVKWTGANLREIITFTSGAPDVSTAVASAKWVDYCDLVNSKGLIIKTLEGEHIATVGDWIIKGVKGECYPCKPDIFELTYEVATPTPIPDADHSEDVRTMVVPDIARFEKHAMKAKDCLSECDVVLLSSIRRLLASPAPSAVVMPAVPDGYKVVPIEPTKEMMDAALMADCGEIDPRSIIYADYKAMLAASPAAKGAKQ